MKGLDKLNKDNLNEELLVINQFEKVDTMSCNVVKKNYKKNKHKKVSRKISKKVNGAVNNYDKSHKEYAKQIIRINGLGNNEPIKSILDVTPLCRDCEHCIRSVKFCSYHGHKLYPNLKYCPDKIKKSKK